MKRALLSLGALAALGFSGCGAANETPIAADVLITGGIVFDGEDRPGRVLDVALREDRIVYVGAPGSVEAARVIDADGLLVMPGFIDPHTHSLSDLRSGDPSRRANANYLFQGVTTVVNGNDGFGEPGVAGQMDTLDALDFGTNTALFTGHGALRKAVMGGEDRAPTDAELAEMKRRLDEDMQAGALGLSTGLFYAPGSFADTFEVVSLARIAARYGGMYDSHMRDEGSYDAGLLASVDEVITIARAADIRANISHIKALGADVWGESEAVVARVEAARTDGLSITADQYPWRASGTRISNALLPRWVKAGSVADYIARLDDPAFMTRLREDTADNLRLRGGPEAVLITAPLGETGDPDWVGKTLGEIAARTDRDPVETALEIARRSDARIASFNMSPDDMRRFMQQSWVMTSSDGSTGHPRKYASYPMKYRRYVVEEGPIDLPSFVHRSTGLVADTFGLCRRGYLRKDLAADVIVIDPDTFAPRADFQNPEELSDGVLYAFVNGEAAIDDGVLTGQRPGRALRRCRGKMG